MTANRKRFVRKLLKALGIILLVLSCLLLLVSFVLYYSAQWYSDVYGDLGFDSILFTLFANLNGVQSGLLTSWAETALPPAIFISTAIILPLAFHPRKQLVMRLFGKLRVRLYPLPRLLSAIICLVLCGGVLTTAARIVDLDLYLANLAAQSHIYEEEYRDPKTTAITFPEEKRNLIYIFLESMETSYLSREQGGALGYCTIPELYELADSNINFSHSQDVGGFAGVPGTTWTVGAMVAQTAGIPLKTPPGVDGNGYGSDGTFLPGVTTLTDVLHENGYYQTLMVGSDASFGGRRQYFAQHSIDRIYDLYTAREDGLIPEDYYVWWGFEDKYLFEYARQELTEISQRSEPFAFTMLTVDTHHIGGYLCEYCTDTYAEQYENAIACSSRQVAAFVEWIKQQDFYENTTIIIAGDHCSMDYGYFQRVAPGLDRRYVYNCFINPATEPANTQNRAFCALDLFPTTLAAMGCQIDGERLGLGTNLFSQVPTLLEQYPGVFYHELAKSSNYYTDNFFFSK